MFKREVIAKIAASIAMTLVAGWITRRITRQPATAWVVGVFVGTIAHELLDQPLTQLLAATPDRDD
jgi:hypothetical protein